MRGRLRRNPQPAYVRSDNGPEFIAKTLREWIAAVGSQTAYIEPGSPWENGYCESFNSKLRDELLDGEIFFSLTGGPSADRGLAAPLQCRAPSQLAQIQTASARNSHPPRRRPCAMGERASYWRRALAQP